MFWHTSKKIKVIHTPNNGTYIYLYILTKSELSVALIESFRGKINSSLRFPPKKYYKIIIIKLRFPIISINLQYLITAIFTGAIHVIILKFNII